PPGRSTYAHRATPLRGVVDVGDPESAYSASFLTDPGDDHAAKQQLPIYNRLPATFGLDRYLLTNPTDDEATFVGVEFTLQTTFERGFLMAGATAGRADGVAANVGIGPLGNAHRVHREGVLD